MPNLLTLFTLKAERGNEEKYKNDFFTELASSVLFDCKNPSILSMKKKIDERKLEIYSLNDHQLKQAGYFCENNIWHSKDKPNLNEAGGIITVFLDNSLSTIPLYILGIMNKKNICNDVMKLVNHPAHVEWNQKNKYKNECDKNKLYKALLDQFNKDLDGPEPNKDIFDHRY